MNDYIKIILIKTGFFLIKVTFVVLAAYQHPLLVIPSYLLVEIATKMAFRDLDIKILYYPDDILDGHDINKVEKEQTKEDVNIEIKEEVKDVVQSLPVVIQPKKNKTSVKKTKKSSIDTNKKQVGAKRIVSKKKPKN